MLWRSWFRGLFFNDLEIIGVYWVVTMLLRVISNYIHYKTSISSTFCLSTSWRTTFVEWTRSRRTNYLESGPQGLRANLSNANGLTAKYICIPCSFILSSMQIYYTMRLGATPDATSKKRVTPPEHAHKCLRIPNSQTGQYSVAIKIGQPMKSKLETIG